MQRSESHSARLHIAVSGSTGLIGSALVTRLASAGHHVRALVRRPAGPGEISWDPDGGRLAPGDLEGVSGVIHLAGENIGARWTRSRKARIRASRVHGTRLLSETLSRMARPPRVLISASAIGVYGNRGDEMLSEESSTGDPSSDFLAATGREWEASADAARRAGIRVVHPRFGVVLSREGGALGRMLLPFQLGVGGRLGSGTQWMSWIGIDDAVGAIVYLLENDAATGPVNVTSPEPVSNREFTRTLGRVLRRPAVFPVPAAGLRLLFGEMADATLLASARVLPSRLLNLGFRFDHPLLEPALRHVLRKEG